jgi:hypothetical protein
VSTLAFGVKAHSGWAALVAVAENGGSLDVALRRRLELTGEPWHKHPYHAAEDLEAAEAEALIARAIAAAHAHAEQALAAALAERRSAGDEVVACGVLLGAGMPAWSTREIVAVHVRMHKAEGELFREALVRGAERAGLPCIGVREKEVEAVAGEALRLPAAERARRLSDAGRRAGPPWARDQKDAALAAWIALRRARRG